MISNISGGATPLRSDNTQYADNGIKFLRIQNITPLGFDFSDVKYITNSVHNNLLRRSQLADEDLLMTITGRIGTCAVISEQDLPANINQHIVRIRLKHGIIPQYIASFLNSNIGLLLSNRGVTGTTRVALDYESIKRIPIPLINEQEQKVLVLMSNEANEIYLKKLQKANELVINTKRHIFSSIGVSFSDYIPSLFSYHKLSNIIEYGIYCNPHSAYLNVLFEHLRTNQWYAGHLEEYVDVNPRTDRTFLSNESVVSFVPMAAVAEKINRAEYSLKTYAELKTGFTIFQKNDLLWAKITPCMQNGKSFLASDMPTDIGFGSTEFHVLRKKSNRIYMPYLWVLLSEDHVLEAAQAMFSGSAGQQRVPDTFLKKFPILLPPIEMQRELADNVFDALEQAKIMQEEAEQTWETAKKQFEKKLLEGAE